MRYYATPLRLLVAICVIVEVTCGNMRYCGGYLWQYALLCNAAHLADQVLGQRQALGKVYKLENPTM